MRIGIGILVLSAFALALEFAARLRGRLSRLSLDEGKEIESIKRFKVL
jgi:hypothetical protein